MVLKEKNQSLLSFVPYYKSLGFKLVEIRQDKDGKLHAVMGGNYVARNGSDTTKLITFPLNAKSKLTYKVVSESALNIGKDAGIVNDNVALPQNDKEWSEVTYANVEYQVKNTSVETLNNKVNHFDNIAKITKVFNGEIVSEYSNTSHEVRDARLNELRHFANEVNEQSTYMIQGMMKYIDNKNKVNTNYKERPLNEFIYNNIAEQDIDGRDGQ